MVRLIAIATVPLGFVGRIVADQAQPFQARH